MRRCWTVSSPPSPMWRPTIASKEPLHQEPTLIRHPHDPRMIGLNSELDHDPSRRVLTDSPMHSAPGGRHQDHIGEVGACKLVCDTAVAYPDSPHFLARACAVILALSELERSDEMGRSLHIWK